MATETMETDAVATQAREVASAAMIAVPDDYLDLVRRFPLVSIRDGDHLAAAYAMMDEMSSIDEDRLTPGQADYLYALADLTIVYDADVMKELLRETTGLDALRHMAEEHDLSADDVGRLVGRPGDGAALFSGEVEISRADARAFARRFHMPAELFLKDGLADPTATSPG